MSITLKKLKEFKQQKQKFCCLTAYDASFARVISECGIEVILIGDSLGMTIQGHDSTLPVSVAHMAYHTQCVSRGNRGALLIADLPFMAASSKRTACKNAAKLMCAGAHVVKIEGGEWLCSTIQRLTACGVPVCAHLGLMPQSVNLLSGYRRQGGTEAQAQHIRRDAQLLTEAGAALLLLECVPSELAQTITAELAVPVIGIGCGGHTDAQVLVLQDILGLSEQAPGFAPSFMGARDTIQQALQHYAQAVRAEKFPESER